MRYRYSKTGYLLVLVTVCVCMAIVGFLRLAAAAASASEGAELEYARAQAFYLAEGGLVLSQAKLNLKSLPKSKGPWFSKATDSSGLGLTVEVIGMPNKLELKLLSTGHALAPGERKVSLALEATAKLSKDKKWSITSVYSRQ